MKLVTIIGARPQFIKASVVSKAIKDNNLNEIIIHTGQHFDANMSSIFFDELSIPKPDYNLNIHGLHHGAMTGRMLEEIEKIFLKIKPDIVIVYGDTNSTLAGALAAAKLHIPVAHIEAGLRSFNKRMPEEVNRILTDNVSEWLFAPTKTAVTHLENEKFDKSKIHLVGDVMCDSALHFSTISEQKSTILKENELIKDDYILATIHRAENTDNVERLINVVNCLAELSRTRKVVFPIHPRTRAILNKMSLAVNKIHFIDPVGYLDMINLEKNASLIITDSGGVQKEAYFFQKPCVTFRNETEWQELVDYDWNILVSPDKPIDVPLIESRIGKKGEGSHLYGDGKASEKIVGILSRI